MKHKRSTLASVLAVACYLGAGLSAFAVALLAVDASISPRQLVLMGGFALLLIGWGGVISEYAAKQVLLRPDSTALKLVVAGSIAMLGSFAAA